MTAPVLRQTAALRALVLGWKAAGETLGVVPTMGALHEGHLSLVRAARAECDRVIVTIFVNPLQFNNQGDLASYPRNEGADAALLATVGVDVIFAPGPDEVYPAGFVTTVSVGGVSLPMEGEVRPGHFDGVATVVAKLFGMTMADRAYFGQKDWQQLAVVKRLVRDLNIGVWVVGCETIREPDGLAMSSRNARLGAVARAKAPALWRAMTRAAAAVRAGGAFEATLAACRTEVMAAGFQGVEYVELCDASTLMAVEDRTRPMRLLAAAWLDGVRLIDNIAV